MTSDDDAPIREIDRSQLQSELRDNPHLQLLMAASSFGFRVKHIPGSQRFDKQHLPPLRPEDPVVVYCSNDDCHASIMAYKFLRERGFRDLRHYRGGIIDWEGAGLPVEGDWAAGGDPPAAP